MTSNRQAESPTAPAPTDAEEARVHTPFGVLAMAGAAGVAYLLAHSAAGEAGAIAWSGIALTFVGISATLHLGRPLGRSLAQLRLGPWFALGYAITFGLTTLGIAYPLGEATQGLAVWVDADLALRAVPLLAAFMAAVAVVYPALPARWARGIGASARRQARAEATTYGRPVVLLLVGVFATLLLIQAGTFGYAADAATLVESAGPFTNALSGFSSFITLVAFWMSWRLAKTHEPLAGLITLAAATVGVSLGLASGMKEETVMPLLAVALGWSCARARFNWRGLMVVVVIFFVLVYPIVNSFRQAVTTGTGRIAGAEGIAELRGALGARAQLTETVDAGISRLSRMPDFAVITSLTPEVIPYRPTSDLLSAPVLGLVPRAFWPDKPVLSTGYQFSQEYYGRSASIITSSAVTPEGDLFRHGGWLILILGGAGMGLLLRLLDCVSEGSPDPRLYFLPVSIFPLIVKHEMDFIGLVAAMPTALVVFWVALRLSGCTTDEGSRPVTLQRAGW